MENDLRIYGPPLAPPVELSRWLLERIGENYDFRPEAAGLSAIRSRLSTVPTEPPLLILSNGKIGGLRGSFATVLGSLPIARGDTPPPVDLAFADALFSGLFSQAVRTFYWHMLDHPDVLKPMSTTGVPLWHRLAIYNFYPLWRGLLTKGLKLSQFNAKDATDSIGHCFELASDKLRSGKEFIGGDAPDLNDIIFSVLASPVVLPRDHPVKLPEPSELPESFRKLVDFFRGMPGGQLALRTYRFRRPHSH